MAATFDPNLATDLDRMRYAVGDTNVAAPFDDDVTYIAMLAAYTDWRLAAAAIARGLASRAINRPNSFTAVGDVSLSWGDRATAWLKIAANLEAQVAAEATTTDGAIGFALADRADLVQDDAEYSNGLRGWC
jgi:hypothetical protein